MMKTSVLLLSLTLLSVGCASVPQGPQPSPQVSCPNLPDLEPELLGQQEPTFTQTMESFLQGKLILRSESAISVIPATGSTAKPRPK